MRASATDLNKHSGRYINHAIKEPVIIEKSGQPIVVMVSYEHYTKLEDAYWGERAIISDKEQSLGIEKSSAFLNSDE
jgi:prevent-host-death family protein